jgi:hypothetical protein
VFIFENLFRRNLAANDAAEEAIRVSHSWVTCAETIAKGG